MDDHNVTEFKSEDTQGAGPAEVDTDRAEDHSTASSNSLLIATVLQYVQDFLSTAGDNSIILALVGLAIATYVILGSLGLLLIGIVSGVLLHAYWDGANDVYRQDAGFDISSQKRRTKELSIEVASRLLQWRSVKPVPDSDESRDPLDSKAEASPPADIHFPSFRPSTRLALLNLTDAVIRDYVAYWYRPILPGEESFPLSCRKTLAGFITSLSSHLARKRPADTFLQFVTNSSSMIIVFLNELSLALQDTSSDLLPAEEVVKNYLARYPESNLANVLSVDQQQKKLKMVADDILGNFLERTTYNCETVRTFLREIFAGVVLDSIIRSCSQPDFINNWIVFLLEEGEPELMNAIDANLGKPVQNAIALETSSGDANNFASSSFQITKSFNDVLEPSEQINLSSTDTSEPYSSSERSKATVNVSSSGNGGSLSSTTTEGMITPTSSDSEKPIERLEDDISFNGNRHYVGPDGGQQNSAATAELNDEQQEPAVRSLTLYGASVWIDDGSEAGAKSLIRTKPSIDYPLQIEPLSARQPGWMIFKNYSDFEFLHEGLATLSRYHHIVFLDKHPSLPTWKGSTKQTLTRSLENYLRDALQYEQLAESERMRRFLGKESNLSQLSQDSVKSGFSFPRQTTFENMGKGVLEVFTNAPKGVAGGGKAVLEGVSGVFAGVGLNKKTFDITTNHSRDRQSTRTSSTSAIATLDKPQPDYQSISERPTSLDFGDREQSSTRPTDQPASGNRDSAQVLSPASSPVLNDQRSQSDNSEKEHMHIHDISSPERLRPDGAVQNSTFVAGDQAENNLEHAKTAATPQQHEPSAKVTPQGRSSSPLTEDETRVAVELIFAVINELYTLSSAWNIRKTLLNAAKSYIIRPGNPNLEAIRALLQESTIDAQTSDEAIAAQITKLRENSLPTPEELSLWPSPLSMEESEKLKLRARKLLIQRGMPQALMSVMGAAATGEALGKVFDCLQVEEVGRGLIFAIVLQALRALIL